LFLVLGPPQLSFGAIEPSENIVVKKLTQKYPSKRYMDFDNRGGLKAN